MTVGASALHPFLARGGFEVWEELLGAADLQSLIREAARARVTAQESCVLEDDLEEVRGGQPARRFFTGLGGPVQRALAHSPDLRRELQARTGLALAPLADGGSFTWYAGQGHHLAVHRDIPGCEVAVITCLSASGGPRAGGHLHLWPPAWSKPLSSVRAAPASGRESLWLRPGQTLVLFGGAIPHAVTSLRAQHERLVSVFCFSLVDRTATFDVA